MRSPSLSTLARRCWPARPPGQRHQLKPHLTKTFTLSRDKAFLKKSYDTGGLYLNPPDRALVLCVDEKWQLQALDRTRPGLPLKRSR